ncbi:MAG: WYL domain-containing protein, partial [Ginsengibacter sp.]
LPKILMAIANSKVIEMNYTSIDKHESLQRKAEPVGIYYQGSHWYLVAFCRLRNDYRNFRTDMINNFLVLEENIMKAHPPLQSFINKVAAKKQLRRIIIDVEKDIVKYFGEQKYYNGFINEEAVGDFIRMTFLSGSLTGFARWFMVFGDRAHIVEPLELNDIVVAIAENILRKIEENQMLLT